MPIKPSANLLNPKKQKTQIMSFSKMIGSSTRLTLTYIVLFVWIALAIFAILEDADLYGLAVYFASGLPIILGYLWSETSRPTLKDAADIVKGINVGRGNNGYSSGGYGASYGGYGGSYGGASYSGYDTANLTNQNTDVQNQDIVSIYSDDSTVELKVNQNQLSTLKNIGYVDMIGDKLTFKKSLLDQIKSLINDNTVDPII